MLTSQQMFDTIVTHLRQQGKKAQIDDDGAHNGKTCCYRTPEGLKCAAGCLIPDECYNPELENKTVHHSKVRLVLSDIVSDFDLLRRLQGIHDIYPIEEWETEFLAVSNDYRLNYRQPS